jgi:hypothetical protein
MKIEVRLVLFSSPSQAWGDLKGELEVPSAPAVGEEIAIFDAENSARLELPTHHKVKVVHHVSDGTQPSCIVVLEDLIVAGKTSASETAKVLAKQLGMFVWEY